MIAQGAKRSFLLFLALGVLAMLPSAQAGPRESAKLDKQIAIFERVMDHMLVESPNFLVRGQDNTQGTYIEGHGAVFTFKTSLNSHRWSDSGWSWRRILKDHDDDHWSDRDKADEKELYTKGKGEIVETIRDFGEMLTTLGDGDWLEIRVRLKGAEYFRENRLRKLTVRVLMRDVRAYLDGELSESRFGDQVEIKES